MSLSPVSQCALAIKSALKNLLLEVLLKNDNSIVNNDKYLTIKKAMDSREAEIETEFLIRIKPIFDKFMTQVSDGGTNNSFTTSKLCETAEIRFGRLLKSSIYIDKKGKTLKESYPEKVELQLENDQFKTTQGKQNVTMYFMCLLVLNISHV